MKLDSLIQDAHAIAMNDWVYVLTPTTLYSANFGFDVRQFIKNIGADLKEFLLNCEAQNFISINRGKHVKA